MKNVHILFITHYASLYGANRSLLNLISALRQNYKVNVTVLIPEKGDIEKVLLDEDIPYHIEKFWSWVHDGKISCNSTFEIIKKLARNIITALRLRKGIKTYDLIYSNSSLVFLGMLLSLLYRKKHIWHVREFLDLDYNLKLDLGKRFSIWLMRFSDQIIFISNAVKIHFKASNWKNTQVIYNGVFYSEDERLLHVTKKLESFIFIIVGLVNPNKGQIQAIKAFSEVYNLYKNSRLRIIGGGDLASLERLVRKLDLGDVIDICGELEDPTKAFQNCDVVLMCSKFEGMGRVTAEAMAYGKPVIGYNSTGTNELIKTNCNGLLYRTVDELKDAMIKLIDNPGLAKQLGKNGRKKFLDQYTIEKYTNSIYQVIKDIVNKNAV